MITRQHRSSRKLRTEALENRELLHGGSLGGVQPALTTAERVEAAFSRLDSNDDAVLNADDGISERLWDRISAADADENGITQQELLTHVEAQIAEREGSRSRIGLGGGRANGLVRHRSNFHRHRIERLSPAERLDRFYDTYDDNEDGLLTADEVPERVWERLAPADTNEDGVSREEWEAHREALRAERFDAAFARLDADESGGITSNEVSERGWTRLSEADANDDGAVTKQELQDHLESKRAEREADEMETGEAENNAGVAEVANQSVRSRFVQRVQRFTGFRR